MKNTIITIMAISLMFPMSVFADSHVVSPETSTVLTQNNDTFTPVPTPNDNRGGGGGGISKRAQLLKQYNALLIIYRDLLIQLIEIEQKRIWG